LRLIDVARSYLRHAEARLRDAKEALAEGLYSYALRLSQECVELSLKASLKIVGIEYPKKHDVADVLLMAKGRFPGWFQSKIDFLADTSRTLAKKREVIMYGDEALMLSPDEVVSGEEARAAVESAEKTYRLCKRLLNEYEKVHLGGP
jgi:HEPN domain-containing protein